MKKMVFVLAVVCILLSAGCQKTEEVNDPLAESKTFTVTAVMPVDNGARIATEQQDDRSIKLMWQEGDWVDLCLVQGSKKIARKVTVKNISDDRLSAQLDITTPDGWNGEFNLYGIYGGNGLVPSDPIKAVLPSDPWSRTGLSDGECSVENKKDVMLYCKLEHIDPASGSDLLTSFEHIGALFCVLVNTAKEVSTSVAKAEIKDHEATAKIPLYNNVNHGGMRFDLITGTVDNVDEATILNFEGKDETVAPGVTRVWWGWYPPNPATNTWPDLKLTLRTSDEVEVISTTYPFKVPLIPKRGKVYYIHAVWDGEKLTFMPPIEWVDISGGTFTMGTDENEAGREGNETQHQVSLSAFRLSAKQITFAQYDAYCEATGREKPDDSGWGRGNRPVTKVTWYDAMAFADWVGASLPTEAQWEYACRAGTTSPFNTGNNFTTDQGNYNGDFPYTENPKGIFRGKTVEVGSFAPNAWGLYDMHGNAWEWCSDWYALYSTEPMTDPNGPEAGTHRVFRGGCCFSWAQHCRSGQRNCNIPSFSAGNVSFRLAAPLK